MFPTWPYLAGLAAAVLTLALPRRWLLVWLPFFWSGTILLWKSIDFEQDWALIGAAIVFSPIWLLNGTATVVRAALIVADLIRDSDRGY
jgi:hypothetical protein